MFRFVRAPEKKKDSIIAIGDIQMIVRQWDVSSQFCL